jgi:prepilin-type processing-associated H-X9-DG protein/prepilin-type N-terminal cleavage/methylation domain-containing protein
MVQRTPAWRLKQAGFTLLETLVVIGMIGVLVGILVPATMKVRVSAIRLRCENNLRQFGLAMHSYAGAHEGFPSGVTYSMGWDKGTPTGTIHLWSAYLLPHLDQRGVADRYDFAKPFFANTTAITTDLSVFQCPATPEQNRTTTVKNWSLSKAYGISQLAVLDKFLTTPSVTMAAGDYASYVKVHDDWKLYLSYPPGAPDLVGVLGQPPFSTADDNKALLAGGEIAFTSKPTRPSEVTDGLSYTVLLIEDAGKPQVWSAGQLVAPGDVLGGAGWADPGGLFYLRGDIESGCLINCNNTNNIFSFHPGGANFLFADGSARFLSTSTSLKTVVALLTAKSGDIPGNDW